MFVTKSPPGPWLKHRFGVYGGMSPNSCFLPMQLFSLKTRHLHRGASRALEQSFPPMSRRQSCHVSRTPAVANATTVDHSRNHRLQTHPVQKTSALAVPGAACLLFHLCPPSPGKGNRSQMSLGSLNRSALQDIWASRPEEGVRGQRYRCAGRYFAVCHKARSELTWRCAIAWSYESASLHERCPRNGENCQAATRRRHRDTPIGNGASPPPSPCLALAFNSWVENSAQVLYCLFWDFLCQTQ